jgi:poly-gamma-glutamate capsule biosynthesis protein CapA/YwtB (metallophosphatase superfamily)
MSRPAPDPRRAAVWSRILVISLVAIFLLGMLGFAVAVLEARREGQADSPAAPAVPAIPSDAATGPTGQALAVAQTPERHRSLLALADPTEPPSLVGSPPPATPGRTASASPTAALASVAPGSSFESGATTAAPAMVETRMPIVPVTGFWSARDSLQRAEIKAGLVTGTAPGFRSVVVEASIADALAAWAGTALHADVRRLSAAGVARAVTMGALGLVAATSMSPSMRTLEIGGRALVGVDRVQDVSDWPLSVTLQVPEGRTWDQSRLWVLVAGGDSFTDRGVYDTVVRKGKGVDFPFGGGTARVTGHGCCDVIFHDNVVPRYVLTGHAGLVRHIFKAADLAIANHEQPVTPAAQVHRSGTRFGGRPDLTRIFTSGGIDFLSLANNHIGDYGASGISDTRRVLKRYGIAFGGAGEDLAQARRVRLLQAAGTSVAIIPCLDIVKAYWADDSRAGATPCLDRYIRKDIRKARRAGADVVIVFPHWGVEYTRQPLESMRRHASRWVDAGADLVLGSHSHVAGAIEEIDGTPVIYSMGNLVFDQQWSTNTMESAFLEMTFDGDHLVELRLRPYVIHAASQPNLLDPATGEGRRLLRAIRQASSSWLEW